MCYSAKSLKNAALKRALHAGDKAIAEQLREELEALSGLADRAFVNAFDHPALVGFTDAEPYRPQLLTWGLIPAWTKDEAQARKLRVQTLNARGETIFEKPAFRKSAMDKRCLIFVNGFYEHQHFMKRTYPWYIHVKGREAFALAGLWDEWRDPASGLVHRTFSIVTTAGNPLMAKIHNNPKLDGPRMPLILPAELEDEWLKPVGEERDVARIKQLLLPFPAEEMEAHTVRPLLGKAKGDDQGKASEPFAYPELAFA
ncbi:MAG: SOS response-associated peptidase [Flavobacteriales bacterium]|nr:SOS response-associated peptidase [Flavobacteriales bacterium]MBP9081201.1 SOS response-associated peptidase [Flavobacteriales bacterium]